MKRSSIIKSRSSKRILVVDDEPFNLKSMKVIIDSVLKKLGLEEEFLNSFIDQAQNGLEAF